MLKKCLAFLIAVSISHVVFQIPTDAHAQDNKDTQQLAERIKANVAAIGVGARVSIKLRNKDKLTGYISQISEKNFVVTKAKEGAKETITYADATEVKVKNEKRISTAGKILIVFGVLTILSLIGNRGFGG